MNGWPYLSDTCSGKHLTAYCDPAPLITVHQWCMLDTEHIVSTVKCKFNSQKCYSVDCCFFVLGWWVQCHVLCQQWCCACWSWWNTQSYEACCCTGDTQLGSVNYTMKTYLMQSFPKFHFKQNMHDNAAVSNGCDTRCYFNVRSKADISRLNLPHGTWMTCFTKIWKLSEMQANICMPNVT